MPLASWATVSVNHTLLETHQDVSLIELEIHQYKEVATHLYDTNGPNLSLAQTASRQTSLTGSVNSKSVPIDRFVKAVLPATS